MNAHLNVLKSGKLNLIWRSSRSLTGSSTGWASTCRYVCNGREWRNIVNKNICVVDKTTLCRLCHSIICYPLSQATQHTQYHIYADTTKRSIFVVKKRLSLLVNEGCIVYVYSYLTDISDKIFLCCLIITFLQCLRLQSNYSLTMYHNGGQV